MWSAYLLSKLSSIKTIAENGRLPSFTLFQQSQSLSSTILIIPRLFTNLCSINYCSLVDIESRKKESDEKSDYFTVSYLVNSCGFSAQRAILLSKKVNFESPEKPNAVLGFLRNQGFSQNQMSKIVKSVPGILLYNPEKTLLPKIEFLRSIWESRTDLANNLSENHHLLVRSLKNCILPIFNFFRSIFLTDDRIASAAMWRAAFYCKNPIKILASNIAILRELGVPESCIRMGLAYFPKAMMQESDQFVEAVSEVKEMGFDPSSSAFMRALHGRSRKGNRFRWEQCYEVYRNWGWSEDNIRMAYRSHPGCMLISEQKLTRMMDFLVNKLCWNCQSIARYPNVLCLSLEKRIIPRGSVIHFLCLKGLIKKDMSLDVFRVSEKKFLGRFVTPYVEQVPQIHDVYQGKMGIFPV